MKHEEIRAKILSVLDAETPREEKIILEGHLASCPQCRSDLDAWRQASPNIQNFSFPVPSGFARGVMEALAPEAQAPSGFRGWLSNLDLIKWEAFAAGGALAVLLLYTLLPHSLIHRNGISADPPVVLARSGLSREDVANAIFQDEESALEGVFYE